MPASRTLTFPDGWYIERTEQSNSVNFDIYDGEYKWTDDTPRSVLEVIMFTGRESLREYEPRISWPSTSDKRPRLARALAAALDWAASEAKCFPPQPEEEGVADQLISILANMGDEDVIAKVRDELNNWKGQQTEGND